MDKITVLILAAGRSRRFNTEIPKQFYPFKTEGSDCTKQMWENVVEGLTIPHQRVVALRHEYLGYGFYDPSEPTPYLLLERTEGQGETLLRSLDILDGWETSKDLLVVNSDAGFKAGVLDNFVKAGRSYRSPTVMTMPRGGHEEKRWSWTNGHPTFYYITEKVRLRDSADAVMGAYYFPDIYAVRNASAQVMKQYRPTKSDWEPYISHVINELAGIKYTYRISSTDHYDWGTPEKLQSFLRRNDQPVSWEPK